MCTRIYYLCLQCTRQLTVNWKTSTLWSFTEIHNGNGHFLTLKWKNTLILLPQSKCPEMESIYHHISIKNLLNRLAGSEVRQRQRKQREMEWDTGREWMRKKMNWTGSKGSQEPCPRAFPFRPAIFFISLAHILWSKWSQYAYFITFSSKWCGAGFRKLVHRLGYLLVCFDYSVRRTPVVL